MNVSPDEAKDMLRRAEKLSRDAARFPLSWVGYAMMCAGGPIFLVANFSTSQDLPGAFLGITLMWTLVGAILSVTLGIVSRPAPKGYGTRWGVMIALWTIVWVLTAVGATYVNTDSQLVAGSAVFAAFAVAGPYWEYAAQRNRKLK